MNHLNGWDSVRDAEPGIHLVEEAVSTSKKTAVWRRSQEECHPEQNL